MDANPGQLNETWAKVDRPGVYFGQCSELCGARHGYMPIAIEAVSPAQFAAWVASKGGTMPAARGAGRPGAAAPRPDSTGISPVTEAAVPAAARPQPNAGSPPAADPSAVKQPATNQAATAQN
jgi:cytochrome c oxidase subunit 2